MAFDLVTGLGGGGGGPVNAGYTLQDMYTVSRGLGGFRAYAYTSEYADNSTLFFLYYGNGWQQFGSGLNTTALMTSYTTIVDITSGSGTLLFVLTGAPSGNDTYTTFKITIDGTVREIGCYQKNGWRGLCIASPIRQVSGTTFAADRMRGSFSTTNTGATVPTPEIGTGQILLPAMSSGREEGVRFESSCKVEIKSTSGWRITDPWDWNLAAVFLDQAY